MQKPNTKLIKILLIVAGVLLISAGAVFAVNSLQPDDTTPAQTDSQEQATATESTLDKVEYTATAEGSALDQLLAINDSVVTVESEMGVYVDSINGLAGGTDGKYWSFYVDGEMAAVGAADYQPKGGETIEWVFQKL